MKNTFSFLLWLWSLNVFWCLNNGVKAFITVMVSFLLCLTTLCLSDLISAFCSLCLGWSINTEFQSSIFTQDCCVSDFIPIGHLRSHYCSAMTRQCELGGWTRILACALIVLFMKRWKHQMTLKHMDRKSVSVFQKNSLPANFFYCGWNKVVM